jgi:hypothetical protein
VEQAGGLRQRVVRAHGAVEAGARAHPARKAVVLGAVVLHARLRLRPRAVEQRQQPVVEHVEKALQRGIAALAQALAHVLGQVQRHRPLRPEQAEEVHAQPRHATLAAEAGQGGRGKAQLRLLPQAQRLLHRPHRAAEARRLGRQVLHAAQQREEVVRMRRRLQRVEQRLQRGCAFDRQFARGHGRLTTRRRWPCAAASASARRAGWNAARAG